MFFIDGPRRPHPQPHHHRRYGTSPPAPAFAGAHPPTPRGAGRSGTHRVRNAVLGLGCRCSASLPAARLLDHRRGGGVTRELGAQHPVPGCEAREGRVRKRTPGGPALPLRDNLPPPSSPCTKCRGLFFYNLN